MCRNTQTQANTHSHLGQGQTCWVAEVSNIKPPHFFVIILVTKHDIQFICTGRDRLLYVEIHHCYKCGQLGGIGNEFTYTFLNPLQFHTICTQYFQIHKLHAGWVFPICSFCSVEKLHTAYLSLLPNAFITFAALAVFAVFSPYTLTVSVVTHAKATAMCITWNGINYPTHRRQITSGLLWCDVFNCSKKTSVSSQMVQVSKITPSYVPVLTVPQPFAAGNRKHNCTLGGKDDLSLSLSCTSEQC